MAIKFKYFFGLSDNRTNGGYYVILKGGIMAKPLDPKEIVTVQELAVSNMLEIAALRELLFQKGVITKHQGG